jgi:hypothetical protein
LPDSKVRVLMASSKLLTVKSLKKYWHLTDSQRLSHYAMLFGHRKLFYIYDIHRSYTSFNLNCCAAELFAAWHTDRNWMGMSAVQCCPPTIHYIVQTYNLSGQ